MNTISELIERAHSQAKAMGWWDGERNMGEVMMLIVSECGEALEAHRSGRRADLKRYDFEMNDAPLHVDDPAFLFRSYIKDTFEDELADIVIRIADLLGHMNHTPSRGPVEHHYDNVGEDLFHVVKLLYHHSPVFYNTAMLYTFSIAEYHNIDLWRHIDLKLKYNLTRGKKHGKAY